MTAPTRYRERELNPQGIHVEVEVRSPSTWGQEGTPLHYVRYPDASGIMSGGIDEEIVSRALNLLERDGCTADELVKVAAKLRERIPGREYIVTDEQLNLHFEMLPQTLRVQAWGGVYERPMKAQRELEEQTAEQDTMPEVP